MTEPRLTRVASWKLQAQAMKAADPARSCASIARELGRCQPQVWKALNPERALESDRKTREKRRARRQEIDREYSARRRATCEVCGQECGIGTGRAGHAARRCRPCSLSIVDTKYSAIEGMYEDGWPVRLIAAALGYGPTSVPPELHRLRKMGRIGYRYKAYEAAA